MSNTVPLSIRIPTKDAEFIAKLQIEDAVTPSDKVRAIIKSARRRFEKKGGYDECLKNTKDTLFCLTNHISSFERENKIHSELLNIFIDWLADAFAYIASLSKGQDENDVSVIDIEKDVATKIFRLIDLISRLGVTKNSPCYDVEILNKHFTSLEELLIIINNRQKKEE